MAIMKEKLVRLDSHIMEYIGKTEGKASNTDTTDSEKLLSAVEERNHQRVEDILSQNKGKKIINYEGKRKGVKTSALEIAAIQDDLYMIKLLLKNGAKPLRKPSHKDNLSIEKKINVYTARSSPAYITMAYYLVDKKKRKDFVLQSFELVEELTEVINKERSIIWKEKFISIIKRLKTFSVDIVNCCHSVDEVKWLLGGGYYDRHDDDEGICQTFMMGSTFKQLLTFDRNAKHFPIAEKAIETEHKEFMSHNMVQAALWEQWSHGQLKWTENPGFRWTGLYALFAFFAFGIVHQLLPINMILCCKPKSKLYQLFNSPRSCFLSHYFHYAFFLAFIYLYEVLVTFKVDGSTITLESNINYIPILILSIIWFATLCLIEFGQIVTQGISCYFRSYWNILDWIILFSFLISVIIANPYIVGQSLGNPYIYIIFSKLTSVTFVCALLRFMAPFYLSNFIGPTLLIFTDMKFDIIRFLIIFAYVIFAYSLAMYYFYVDVGPGSSDFATLSSSLTILVSSIFGGEGFESLEISNGVWMNLSSNHSNWAESTAEYYTAMGYTLYVLFGIITLIMLLNLCIAMLSDRYTKFKDNIDVQWKFERSKIWMDYIGTKGSNCNALSGTIYLIVVLICLPVVGVLLIRECYREGCQDYDLDSEDDNGNSYEEEGGKEIIIMNEQAEDTDEVVLEMQVIGPDSSENTDSEGSEETNENASDQDSSEKSDSEENEETNENKPTLEFNQLMTLLLERYYDKHYVILKKTLDVADKEDE